MAYIYDLSDAWSGGGAFTGIKLNVTDGGSTAGSLLMDLQVGGSSRFSVNKAGTVALVNSAVFTNSSIYNLTLQVNAASFEFDTFQGFRAPSLTLGASFASPVRLYREADNTLAQRNGVNAQAFNLYNTYTDASNYERGFMRFVSNVLQIGAEKLGTGTARDLVFQTNGLTRLTVAAGGVITINSQRILNGNFEVNATGNGMVVAGGFAIATSGGGAFGALMYNAGYIGFASSTVGLTSAPDLTLWRDAADVLAQRNGTNAQTSRLYGTYTDASNYRRLTNTMSTAGVAEIKPEGAGTGASGNVLHISGLPTSNPGPGILWNNLGAVVVGT